MRVVLQRVAQASVTVDGSVVGQIGPGLLLLVGVQPSDSAADARWLANKCARLRIFPDADGKMNRSVIDVDGGILVVSQFTLYGDCRKGRRPSFVGAARPAQAEPLYEQLCDLLRQAGVSRVETGIFGANMRVDLANDGPVTLLLDSPQSPDPSSFAPESP